MSQFSSRGPHRKTVRRRLATSYHEYRIELRNALATVDAVGITVDIWTKQEASFICLTGHIFNKKHEAVSILLGFRRLCGAHRANNVRKYILNEIEQLGIGQKVCAIASDNASDIKKAVNDLVPGRRH
jgi:hypothetical protein